MLNEVNAVMKKRRGNSKAAGSKTRTTRAAQQDLPAMYNSNVGNKLGQRVVLSSKQQLIQKGKEDAESLSNFLPLF
jgi:hypothetical protein